MILNRIDGVSDETELPSESFAVASVSERSVGEFSIGEPESKKSELKALSKPLLVRRAEHKKSEPLSEPVVLNQGGGERLSHEIVIGRDGGGGIMNTTHKSTIGISPAISCKETVGNEGPGRNKNASNNNNNNKNAGCRDNYVPSTPPLRDSSHTNRRSNNVPTPSSATQHRQLCRHHPCTTCCTLGSVPRSRSQDH